MLPKLLIFLQLYTNEEWNDEEEKTLYDVQVRNLDVCFDEEATFQPDPRRHHH